MKPTEAARPKRIQRQRTKGWQMPENSVYVGRPSKWGNPFRVGIEGDAEQCVEKYRALVAINRWAFPNRNDIKRELRGKNLVCWCPLDQPCHADVLLRIANE